MHKLLILPIIAFTLAGCNIFSTPSKPSAPPAIPAPLGTSGEEIPAPKNTGSTLNLSSQGLTQVTQDVFKKTHITSLDVSNNNLTGALPAEIRHLQNLTTLDASNNQMTGVPAEIGQLKNLQTLDLSNNRLTGLPYELGNLKNLKTLNISGNQYSELDLSVIQESLPKNVTIIK